MRLPDKHLRLSEGSNKTSLYLCNACYSEYSLVWSLTRRPTATRYEKEKVRENVEPPRVDSRKAVAKIVLYWSAAIVLFSYHYSVNNDDREVIERAMKHCARVSLDYM